MGKRELWPGKIVLPGSGAPELGGLAPVANHTLKPSVQIHADLVANLLLTMIIDTMSGSAYPFSAVRRAEPVMGNGLEQRLPAKVVAQLVAEPDLLKLQGEQREAMSPFTDIEGFSTTAEIVNSSDVIGPLDG
mgnify:CR=1 FL=1|tara:strand:+ start:19148 stop:19546 length:399 start_codon:yes stop_codon:yes gene_type:complete